MIAYLHGIGRECLILADGCCTLYIVISKNTNTNIELYTIIDESVLTYYYEPIKEDYICRFISNLFSRKNGMIHCVG